MESAINIKKTTKKTVLLLAIVFFVFGCGNKQEKEPQQKDSGNTSYASVANKKNQRFGFGKTADEWQKKKSAAAGQATPDNESDEEYEAKINKLLGNDLFDEQSETKQLVNPEFLTAVKTGDKNQIKELLELGADVKSRGYEKRSGAWDWDEYVLVFDILMPAVESGDAETVKMLLDAGADAKYRRWEAPENKAILSMLKEAGAEIRNKENYKNNELLNGLVANFLEHGPEPISDEEVKALIKSGINVNVKNGIGATPLMYAALAYRPETVEILIDAGANINDRDDFGKTVFAYASESHGRRHAEDIIKIFLSKGADVNAADAAGITPLMSSVKGYYISPEAVKLLIENGADVKAKDKSGKTALDYFNRSNATHKSSGFAFRGFSEKDKEDIETLLKAE